MPTPVPAPGGWPCLPLSSERAGALHPCGDQCVAEGSASAAVNAAEAVYQRAEEFEAGNPRTLEVEVKLSFSLAPMLAMTTHPRFQARAAAGADPHLGGEALDYRVVVHGLQVY